MRRYDIVSGILLILSTIDFAFAAPVLVQEKHQASVDVVHVPKDLVTVLWERGGDDESMKLVEWFRKGIKALNEQDASKSSVASSSTAPAGPDHGSTNVVQLPAPNPASSIANLNPLMESSRPSMKGDDESNRPEHIPSTTEYGSGRKLMGAYARPPNPFQNKRPWTDPEPNSDWHSWMISGDNPPKRPALAKESGQAHEYEVVNVHSSGSESSTSTDSGPNGMSHDEIDQVIEHIIAPPKPLSPRPPSNTGPSNTGPLNPRRPALPWLKLGPPTESGDEVFQGPSPRQELTGPELHHQSLSTGSQQADIQASIYSVKGNAKQSRRISDTARDVVNAAQRESRLQPAERSLASDPGRLMSSTVVLAHPHMVSEVIPGTE